MQANLQSKKTATAAAAKQDSVLTAARIRRAKRVVPADAIADLRAEITPERISEILRAMDRRSLAKRKL